MCIFIHSSLHITGGPFVTLAVLHVVYVVHVGHGHVVHVGHGHVVHVVHVVYMMHVAWEYNTCTTYVMHAHCYLQLHRRKQILLVLICRLIISERCVYPLHVYHQTPFCHRTLSAEVQDAQSFLVASSCLVRHLCLLGFPRN